MLSFVISLDANKQVDESRNSEKMSHRELLLEIKNWIYDITNQAFSANCLKPSVKSKNRVVTWGSRAWDIFNVNMKEVPIETFCQTNILSNLLIYPEGVSNDVFKVFCDVVDGQFPIITENSQDKGIIF